MRRKTPLIVGAGPAGCTAAILLAEAGARPLLVDRDEAPRDALCGGFLSWRTAGRLAALGIDIDALGATRVTRLHLFAGESAAAVALPKPAFGLSRRALDGAMRARALELGARLVVATVRGIEGGAALTGDGALKADGILLATGKHDVRGLARPRGSDDPALGLRIRIDTAPDLARLLAGRIELHLFAGGYAGIVVQENASINICLAVRKSLLAKAGGDPHALLALLADAHPHFAARLAPGWRDRPVDTIGAVPYGFVARRTAPGLFRLGDQAAVIASLAGEGIGIALESGAMAARQWLEGGAGAAQRYQAELGGAVSRQVRIAGLARGIAESRAGSRTGIAAARALPGLVRAAMRATRIG